MWRRALRAPIVGVVWLSDSIYRRLVREELLESGGGGAAGELEAAVASAQSRNFLVHALSLTATKLGDGLADPKLVLSWLLGALGSPAFTVGLLVPVREAGALLPQLWLAERVSRSSRGRWIWALGSAVQGLCVLGMAGVAWRLEGAAAGWTLLALLSGFALARSVCSVSHKHVLGRTLARGTRGTAAGVADSVAAVGVLSFGLALSGGLLPKTVEGIGWVLVAAGALWLGAGLLFVRLRESTEQAPAPGARPSRGLAQMRLLTERPQLARFIVVRALLMSTALGTPYVLSLGARVEDGIPSSLGHFVVGSALAAAASGFVWGRLADRSSRRVLVLSALLGGAAFATACVLIALDAPLLENVWTLPALVFVIQVASRGVRLGRATHLVDMAQPSERASYTAVSNTAIGLLLLVGGGLSAVVASFGEAPVFGLFAVCCAAAGVLGRGLQEVQQGRGEVSAERP